tara:strand:- start:4356 stop:6476 length:2121 start_codon:yes stop_codon:yes gene_type:complete
MAIWGVVAKAGAGMLKGGAKKIAANRLLGRGKKKPQKPQQGAEQEKGGALAIRPTTSLVPTGPTAIVPSGGGALATTGDSGGVGGGDSAHAIAVSISSKIIRVEKLLKGSVLIKKDIRDDARKAREKASDKAQEKALEKSKDPSAKKGPKLNLPGKGLLAKIFGFFGTVILGWIAVRLVDWLPKIMPVLKKLGQAVDGIISVAGWLLDGLTFLIDWGYKLYDAATGWIKNVIGEEGAEKFDIFMGNLKKLINAFLVWKIIGEKIFKGIVSAIKNVWKTVTKAIRTIWVKLRRLIGRKARIFFKNLASKIGGAAKSGVQWGISKVGGLLSKGGSKLASTGGGKAVAKVGGLAAKWFGSAAKVIAPAAKAAKPFVSKFASRVPILGPIIVAVISLMSGEPLGQALFKGLGAALGGFLGTTAGIAITAAIGVATAGIGAFLGGLITPAMTILGELIGTFIGDLLYNLFLGGGLKEMMGKLKGMLIGGLKKVLAVGDFIKDFISGGFSRFYEGIPKFTVPDFPEEAPSFIPGFGFGSKEKIWNAFKGGIKFLIGPLSLLMGKKIPNLLWLVNPMNTTPLLIKSFFPPKGAKEGGGSKEGADSTSVKPATKGDQKEKKLAEVGDTKGTGDDKEFQKQEKALISANQKNGYEGVMEEIESYAPYEDVGNQPIRVSASDSKSTSPTPEQSESELISVGGGEGEDPFEALDFYG